MNFCNNTFQGINLNYTYSIPNSCMDLYCKTVDPYGSCGNVWSYFANNCQAENYMYLDCFAKRVPSVYGDYFYEESIQFSQGWYLNQQLDKSNNTIIDNYICSFFPNLKLEPFNNQYYNITFNNTCGPFKLVQTNMGNKTKLDISIILLLFSMIYINL